MQLPEFPFVSLQSPQQGPACRKFQLQCQESLESPDFPLPEVIALSPHARACPACRQYAEQLLVLHEEASSSQHVETINPPEELIQNIIGQIHKNPAPQPLAGILTALLSCFGVILAAILAVSWLWPNLGSGNVGATISRMNNLASGGLDNLQNSISTYFQIPAQLGQTLKLWAAQRHDIILLLLLALGPLLWMTRPMRIKNRNSRPASHR